MQPWRMGYKFAGVPATDVSVFSLPMLAPWPTNDFLLRLDPQGCLVCSKTVMSDEWIVYSRGPVTGTWSSKFSFLKEDD